MAINCETKKRIIAYFTSIICGPFANDYSLLAYGDCRVWWAKVNEECKDLSGQHLLSVMALVLCIKCLTLLLSFYPVFLIWLFGEGCVRYITLSSPDQSELHLDRKDYSWPQPNVCAWGYVHVKHTEEMENWTEISNCSVWFAGLRSQWSAMFCTRSWYQLVTFIRQQSSTLLHSSASQVRSILFLREL